METLPPSAFTEIKEEIQRQPIAVNEYRNVAGVGRSLTWGCVGRRCLPPDYSRNCWTRPYLYKLLLDFGAKYVTDISWNAITVNQNYAAAPHYDKNNNGPSFLVAFGEYQGGCLKIHEGDLSGSHNICHRPIITDFSKVLHSVEPFTGDRYSLVYYNFQNNRSVPLPPPSVKQENGKWVFYRGDKKITRKEGLPHPLRGKKKVPLEEKKVRFTVEFD